MGLSVIGGAIEITFMCAFGGDPGGVWDFAVVRAVWWLRGCVDLMGWLDDE